MACLQQHLAAHYHTAEELGAASQMPSTLYVAFPCFKHLPILSLIAFLLQDLTAPSSGDCPSSLAGQSISLAGAEKECCENGKGRQVGQRGEPAREGAWAHRADTQGRSQQPLDTGLDLLITK